MSLSPTLLRDLLALGRVSNLPTVWTNVLSAWVLIGRQGRSSDLVLLLFAMSLFYVGGMLLNDAFDLSYDRQWRQERPLPAGRASLRLAFGCGFGLLAAAMLLGWLVGLRNAQPLMTAIAMFALAGVIVLYDAWHKGNPLAPLIMGAARMLVLLGVAIALTGQSPQPVLIAALALASYTAGLSYVARQEDLARPDQWWPLALLLLPVGYTLWLNWADLLGLLIWLLFVVWLLLALFLVLRHAPGDIPRAVTRMIAGIALFDALILAAYQAWVPCAIAGLCFFLTRWWQKHVPGT